MSGTSGTPHAVADAMLAMVDPAAVAVTGSGDWFAVDIGGATITFGDGMPYSFERLASAIEARIAFERATAMVAAAGEEGAPLWLVAGSGVLSRWLAWSRIDRRLAKVLTLTDRADAAPVVGDFAQRARHQLGEVNARIRVRAGQAVAERIELSHRVPTVAVLGDRALLRIARQNLPETILTALRNDSTRNDRWRAADIVEHPFFTANDLMVEGVRNEGDDVVVELESSWEPLAPVPKVAWTAVPRGADLACPWRAMPREVADLYALAGRGERLLRG